MKTSTLVETYQLITAAARIILLLSWPILHFSYEEALQCEKLKPQTETDEKYNTTNTTKAMMARHLI